MFDPKKIAPSISSFLLGTAVNLSGYQNPQMAVALTVIGMGFLVWPVWADLLAITTEGFRSLTRPRIVVRPVVLLMLGAAATIITVAMSVRAPDLTSLGWLLLFLVVAITFGAAWVLGAVAYSRLTSLRPFAPSAPQEQQKRSSVKTVITPRPPKPHVAVVAHDPAEPPTYGYLHGWQTRLLIEKFADLKQALPPAIIIARPQMVEPQVFARLFENALMRVGFRLDVRQQNPINAQETGVLVAVPNVDAPSALALKVQSIIQQLGFEGRLIPLASHGEFAIFIGPSPL